MTSSARARIRGQSPVRARPAGALEVSTTSSNRQIGWLGAFEDLAGVYASLAIAVGKIGAIADEAAGRREQAIRVDRGHGVPGCQLKLKCR